MTTREYGYFEQAHIDDLEIDRVARLLNSLPPTPISLTEEVTP